MPAAFTAGSIFPVIQPGNASEPARNQIGSLCISDTWPKESARRAMQPYDWGVKAALHGMSQDCNPYTPGTNDYIDWLAGDKDFADEDFLIN